MNTHKNSKKNFQETDSLESEGKDNMKAPNFPQNPRIPKNFLQKMFFLSGNEMEILEIYDRSRSIFQLEGKKQK